MFSEHKIIFQLEGVKPFTSMFPTVPCKDDVITFGKYHYQVSIRRFTMTSDGKLHGITIQAEKITNMIAKERYTEGYLEVQG